jgi:hypothetical protein
MILLLSQHLHVIFILVSSYVFHHRPVRGGVLCTRNISSVTSHIQFNAAAESKLVHFAPARHGRRVPVLPLSGVCPSSDLPRRLSTTLRSWRLAITIRVHMASLPNTTSTYSIEDVFSPFSHRCLLFASLAGSNASARRFMWARPAAT